MTPLPGELTADDIDARIVDQLAARGEMRALDLRRLVGPIPMERLYERLVHLEARQRVEIRGGYRPTWRAL